MSLRKLSVFFAACAVCIGGFLSNEATVYETKAQNQEKLYNMEELLKPVWEGGICYQESVLPVMGDNYQFEPIQLLYPIEEIIEVKSATLTKTYEEGYDYGVVDGKLVIDPDGDIPIMSYAEFHPQAGEFPSKQGGFLCFHEGSYFHERQIVVTYKTSAKYNGYRPEGKGNLLKNIRTKLENGKDIDMLVFGDSISVGGNSSGFTGVSPYLPTYSQLFAEGLKLNYGVSNVHVYNHSVGGKNTLWGVENIENALQQTPDVDLAIVAFGMNDPALSGMAYVEQINQIVSSIQAKNPTTDILVVATMLPNPDSKNVSKNQGSFIDFLLEHCEKEGVAVANVTHVHASLLERKQYADMTGNNINHANDYLARVYAQTLLKTLQDKDLPSDVEDSAEGKAGKGGCGSTASLSGAGIALGLAVAATAKKRRK